MMVGSIQDINLGGLVEHYSRVGSAGPPPRERNGFPFAAVNGDIRMAAARGLHTISAYAAGTPAPGGADRLLGQLLLPKPDSPPDQGPLKSSHGTNDIPWFVR